ncbi:hypothetical protein J3R30DRAFT_2415273 [Lentinula aciculospora]|uniref:Uncharacterized protein n=1 Tax=Lentinula aciculospora TaxID=153920 RepID=A0A9W9AFT1_9AGAR|nr:hypothetical protein J3R30DRAFT_2415273 [Lentinula aciculospora]
MLALSPARDLFALSPSTTKTSYHSSILPKSTFTPAILHESSLPTSYRQKPFVETPAQRRARVAFLRKENREAGKRVVERVESWVREQVQQSAFTIQMSSKNDKVKCYTRGATRRQSLFVLTSKTVPDEIMLGRMLKDSSNLSSITEEAEMEEEPFILYSTPLPQYSSPAAYYSSSSPLSPTKSIRSPLKPSHQRRLSDLEVIPEGLEE